MIHLQHQLKEWQDTVDRILTRDLPEKMDKYGIPLMTIAAQDGHPAFTITVKTMYNANIAAGWDQEKRRKAFDWLDTHGHGAVLDLDRRLAVRDDSAQPRLIENGPDQASPGLLAGDALGLKLDSLEALQDSRRVIGGDSYGSC